MTACNICYQIQTGDQEYPNDEGTHKAGRLLGGISHKAPIGDWGGIMIQVGLALVDRQETIVERQGKKGHGRIRGGTELSRKTTIRLLG